MDGCLVYLRWRVITVFTYTPKRLKKKKKNHQFYHVRISFDKKKIIIITIVVVPIHCCTRFLKHVFFVFAICFSQVYYNLISLKNLITAIMVITRWGLGLIKFVDRTSKSRDLSLLREFLRYLVLIIGDYPQKIKNR